jgi:hypothetical protein
MVSPKFKYFLIVSNKPGGSMRLREPDFIIGLMGLGSGIAGLITGKNFRKIGGSYKKIDDPIGYWLQTILQLLIGIIAMASAFLRRS